MAIVLSTTKNELKARWKKMYRARKEARTIDNPQAVFSDGYFTGKMEYTAWLIMCSVENVPAAGTGLPMFDRPDSRSVGE